MAQTYAKEAFAIASETFSYKEWDQTLRNLSAFVQNDEIAMAMRGYNVPKEEFIEYLEDLLGKAGATDTEKEFIVSLAIDERLSLAPQIHQHFKRMWREAQGICDVRVSSATELTPQDQKMLKGLLRERFRITADITSTVDPELGSGMVIRFNDKVIDQSAKGYAARLKKLNITVK